MKTQRPRDNAQNRTASDPNGRATGPNGDGNSQATGDGQKFAPSLPKRRPEQTAPQQTQAAVALQTRPVSSTPPQAVSADAGTGTSVAQRVWGAMVTYENAIYLAIFLVALYTRVYDVGTKALHHDESLHSVYGRNLYSGAGYRHDPMMHGPLQFHLIAFMYWVFGTSDSTARYASILCGIIVVMSPFFLRKQMGRLPALVCALLLLVSPSVLYFSRMAREDAIFSGTEMIFMVGLWRFISMRKAADFYIMCAGVALMFTIKETAYLTGAVLGVLFLFLFAYQAGYAILGTLFGYLAVLGAVELYLHNLIAAGVVPKLPNIPNTDPDYDTITAFAGSFLLHPQVLSAIALTMMFIAVVSVLFYFQRRKVTQAGAVVKMHSRKAHPAVHEVKSEMKVASAELSSNGQETPPAVTTVAAVSSETPSNGAASAPVSPNGVENAETEVKPLWTTRALTPKRGSFLAHYEPGSLPYVVGALLGRPSVLLTGFLIAATIFVTLYMVFFSDVPRGIASGLFASLGYWIAQQDVARGGQPWFYYILIVPLYEPIAVFFSLAATIFFSWRGVRWVLKNRRESWEKEEPRLGLFNTDRHVPFAKFSSFMPLFLVSWLFGALILYSWAGEKMPWLMEHLSRPAIFLASLFIGALFTSLISRRQQRLVEAGLIDMSPAMMGMQPRQRMAAGAHFSLDDGRQTADGTFSSVVRRLSSAIGLAPRKLAYANANSHPSNSARYSSGRGGYSQAAAMRKGGRGGVPVSSVFSVQDPPWVTWNRPDSVFPFASYLIVFILLALGWGLSISQKMYDVAFRGGTYDPTSPKDVAFGWTWFFPAMMLIITVSYAIWLGPGRAFRYLAVGILSVMLLYELRSGFMLAYRQPDGAQEMAVYVQSSPDVTRVMNELQDFSYATTGAKNVKVVYDSEVSWPFEWYLGDYPNKQFIGGSAPDAGTDAPVMFLGYNRLNDATILKNYVQQRYALRWWFPEEWYKNEFLPNQFEKDENGAIITDASGKQKEASPLAQAMGILGTIGNTIAHPENETKLWNYLMYRELPKPLGSTDFVVFIRRDVAQQWHYLQYKPLPSTDVPIDKQWNATPSIDAP